MPRVGPSGRRAKATRRTLRTRAAIASSSRVPGGGAGVATSGLRMDWTTTGVFDYRLPDDTPMRAELERDLYRALLTLAFHGDVEPLLQEALQTITVGIRARQGYLEITDGEGPDAQRWWIAHGLDADEVEGVRAVVSRGVIAEAVATGETVVTPSALLDTRFAERESV